MKIATKVKEVKLKKGYPLFFRPTWAKFSSDKIIPIAKQLQKVGLLRGVTLALQSLDDETLKIIKRENVKFEKFSELTKTFRDNKIPTYTEMIMGLPGETLESWKKGLEILLSDTKIGTIYIYNCALFPNAPMNEPTYVKFYKIKTVHSPIYLAHSSAQENEIQEFEDIAINTSSYTFEELKEMYLFSWMTLTFHHLGILEYIANYYHQTKGIPYMRFYELVLDFCRTKKSIFSEEYEKVIKYRDNGYAGKGWNHYDSKLGSINWPIEEATWLRFVSKKNELSNGIVMLLNYFEDVNDLKTDSEILKDLAKFQVFLLTTREDYEEFKSENFKFDWKSFFVNKTELQKTHKNFRYKNQILENDYLEWVVKTIWYGRMATRYKLSPERLEQGKFELSELITN
jgi:putative methyltransferase